VKETSSSAAIARPAPQPVEKAARIGDKKINAARLTVEKTNATTGRPAGPVNAVCRSRAMILQARGRQQ
jgi:hypothetical protein